MREETQETEISELTTISEELIERIDQAIEDQNYDDLKAAFFDDAVCTFALIDELVNKGDPEKASEIIQSFAQIDRHESLALWVKEIPTENQDTETYQFILNESCYKAFCRAGRHSAFDRTEEIARIYRLSEEKIKELYLNIDILQSIDQENVEKLKVYLTQKPDEVFSVIRVLLRDKEQKKVSEAIRKLAQSDRHESLAIFISHWRSSTPHSLEDIEVRRFILNESCGKSLYEAAIALDCSEIEYILKNYGMDLEDINTVIYDLCENAEYKAISKIEDIVITKYKGYVGEKSEHDIILNNRQIVLKKIYKDLVAYEEADSHIHSLVQANEEEAQITLFAEEQQKSSLALEKAFRAGRREEITSAVHNFINNREDTYQFAVVTFLMSLDYSKDSDGRLGLKNAIIYSYAHKGNQERVNDLLISGVLSKEQCEAASAGYFRGDHKEFCEELTLVNTYFNFETQKLDCEKLFAEVFKHANKLKILPKCVMTTTILGSIISQNEDYLTEFLKHLCDEEGDKYLKEKIHEMLLVIKGISNLALSQCQNLKEDAQAIQKLGVFSYPAQFGYAQNKRYNDWYEKPIGEGNEPEEDRKESLRL